eukprot:6212009-Pleurochrysis_carterae.AAC.2
MPTDITVYIRTNPISLKAHARRPPVLLCSTVRVEREQVRGCTRGEIAHARSIRPPVPRTRMLSFVT